MEKYKIDNIKDYLRLIHPILMKGYLVTAFIMLNIVGLPTVLVGSPSIIIKVMIVPIIILSIWIIKIRINVEKYQKEYILFVGIFSCVMSVLLIMTAYRFYMQNSKANEKLYIGLNLGVYLLILIFGFRFHLKALREGDYTSEYQRKFNKYGALMAIAPGLGLIIGRVFVANIKDQDLVVIIIAAALLLIAYIIELGINNLHKYYLICQYPEHVKVYSLEKKTKKKSKPKSKK